MIPAGEILPAAPMTPVEEMPAGEHEAIVRLIATLQAQLTAHYIKKALPVRRDAHPKGLGLVRARFNLSPERPAELRHGIFGGPRETFDAVIRFSNGDPHIGHDLAPDVRGIAIKLPDVNGDFLDEAGQDFLLATGEAFFGTNAVDFVDFPDASESFFKTIRYFIGGRRWGGLLQLGKAMKVPASPLGISYFSQTPYRLGPHCVKYQVRSRMARSAIQDPWYMLPVIRHVAGFAAKVSPALVGRFIPADALRDALARDLASASVELEFLVQRWTDLGHLPVWAIEDATKTWPDPWVTVATIDLPQQCRIADRDAEAERMTFNPWHATTKHQPLGGINRARLAIYRTMSAFRNAHNPPPKP